MWCFCSRIQLYLHDTCSDSHSPFSQLDSFQELLFLVYMMDLLPSLWRNLSTLIAISRAWHSVRKHVLCLLLLYYPGKWLQFRICEGQPIPISLKDDSQIPQSPWSSRTVLNLIRLHLFSSLEILTEKNIYIYEYGKDSNYLVNSPTIWTPHCFVSLLAL